MQDPDRVQVLQPRGDVNQYLHRLGFGQREGDICQRALGPGHDQEQGIACVSRVDHRQEHVAAAFGDALADIALAAQEALVERALRALLADHLDRHRRPVIGFTPHKRRRSRRAPLSDHPFEYAGDKSILRSMRSRSRLTRARWSSTSVSFGTILSFAKCDEITVRNPKHIHFPFPHHCIRCNIIALVSLLERCPAQSPVGCGRQPRNPP